jgi:hypothetical protein
MYIVIQGDPLEGFTFTGPFTSRDEADKWDGCYNRALLVSHSISTEIRLIHFRRPSAGWPRDRRGSFLPVAHRLH